MKHLMLLTFIVVAAFLLSPRTVFSFGAFFHNQQQVSLCENSAKTNTSEIHRNDSRRSTSSPRFKTSIRYSSGDKDENKFSNKIGTKKKNKRKHKANKYAEFSKADKAMLDPFESLVKESQQKLQAIEVENKLQRDRPLPKAPPKAMKKLEYPNNEGIDPYDPSSFGYRKIGTITAPHGVHGWVKVLGCTDFPERLTRAGMPLHLKPVRKRAPRKVTLSCGKFLGNDQFLIQLQGYFDRTASESLKGTTLYYATQQDTIIQEDNDVLVPELIGLSVYRINIESGAEKESLVGTVSGVVPADELCAIPGLLHDQLEVKVAREKSESEYKSPRRSTQNLLLIPMVPEIVIKINLEDGNIIIDPPSGLLDLTFVREEKVRIKGLLPPARTD